MGAGITVDVLKQHLIDPEICIRCNTCEETCPSDAISHDSRNYVVDAAKCNACLACIGPCPTGAIDNWRIVARAAAHGVDAQLGWDVLPKGSESDSLPFRAGGVAFGPSTSMISLLAVLSGVANVGRFTVEGASSAVSIETDASGNVILRDETGKAIRTSLRRG